MGTKKNSQQILGEEELLTYQKQVIDSYTGIKIAAYLTAIVILLGVLSILLPEEYKEIVAKGGGYQECLAYFKENLDQKSKYSENWDETVIFKDGSFFAVKDSVI